MNLITSLPPPLAVLCTLSLLAYSLLGQPFALADETHQDQSDFLSLCQAELMGKGDTTVCKRIHTAFFSQGDMKHFAPLTPKQVGAPPMSVDKKVQFLAFNDPNYVSGIGYCYFVFRKWIDPKGISPDSLGLSSTGFAIFNEDLKEYQTWLAGTEAGKACKTQVESESGVKVANLEGSLKDHTGLIALNPLAIIRQKGSHYPSILKEMALTLNHERIHAYQVLCPSFEKWSKEKWEKMPEHEKAAMKRAHPDYNWSDPKVAARESAAFLLEKNPSTVQSHLGSCQL